MLSHNAMAPIFASQVGQGSVTLLLPPPLLVLNLIPVPHQLASIGSTA